MDNILIVTQGNEGGINYELSKRISEFLCDQLSNVQLCIENADTITDERWRELDPYKTIMVVPEWNGSMPYTFKKMIDESGYPSFFSHSEILLIGTSSSPFGNIMGVEHLGYILRRCHATLYHRSFFVQNDNFSDERRDAMFVEILDFCA